MMKTKLEIDEVTTSTTITERFTGPFHGTETTTETIHIKLYPNDSNTFSFSVTYGIELQHSHGNPPPLNQLKPLNQLEHVLLDEHLFCNKICSDHLKNLLSKISLPPSIEDHIVYYISTEALNWKNCRERGYKVEINVNVKVDYKERDGEVSTKELLSSAASFMELGCFDETKKTRSQVSSLKKTRELIKGCIINKEVSTIEIQIKYRSVESDRFSFKVNYEKKLEFHPGNLDGHKVMVKVTYPPPNTNKFEYEFPYQILRSEEPLGGQVINAISEINLPSRIHEYLVDYLSRESALSDKRNGKGIVYEIDVKDNVDWLPEVGCCSGEENACLSRISTTRMAEDCPICLKGLSGEINRMELSCSHLYHKDCVMMWLKNHYSCPLCRNNVDGQVAFLC